MNDRFLLRTAISRLSFLNTEEKKILEKKLDTVSRLALLSIDDLSLAVGRVINSRLWQTEQKQSSMEEQALHDVRIMEAFGIQAVFYDDESYPALLKEIYDPPYALFYRGNMSVLNMPCVSIVGTRRPTGLGMRHTKDLACELQLQGLRLCPDLHWERTRVRMRVLCVRKTEKRRRCSVPEWIRLRLLQIKRLQPLCLKTAAVL